MLWVHELRQKVDEAVLGTSGNQCLIKAGLYPGRQDNCVHLWR